MRLVLSCCPLILSSVFACPGAAWGKVTDSSQQGFVIQVEVPIQASPQQVYRQLVENIGKWWDPSHTFSGDSNNLYLEAEPKGWFGERLADGGVVQHMEVIFIAPGTGLRHAAAATLVSIRICSPTAQRHRCRSRAQVHLTIGDRWPGEAGFAQ